MGELLSFSQSSLLQLPKFQLGTSKQVQLPIGHRQALSAVAAPLKIFPKRLATFPTICAHPKQFSWGTRAAIVSDSKVPTTFTVDSAGSGIDILPDSGGGSDDNLSGNGGGGGGGDGGNDDKGGGSDENEYHSEKKSGLSMSQKLTLGYAILVGIGGLMGYLKSGSHKSLISGGVSAFLLYYVYTVLPSNPVLASSVGLGLSASLLFVMGSRFKASGKIFPAGIVSFVSLIMSGGYLHGILRSMH